MFAVKLPMTAISLCLAPDLNNQHGSRVEYRGSRTYYRSKRLNRQLLDRHPRSLKRVVEMPHNTSVGSSISNDQVCRALADLCAHTLSSSATRLGTRFGIKPRELPQRYTTGSFPA